MTSVVATAKRLASDPNAITTTAEKMIPTVPDRKELRDLYDKVIDEIHADRGHTLLGEFYAKTKEALFNKSFEAIDDAIHKRRLMHTVPSPAGGGKTTFATAFAVAFTRYGQDRKDTPYGCCLVVDQITKADSLYREIDKLAPGKIAVWTNEHNIDAKTLTRLEAPAAQFNQDDLRRFPIVIVTHKFYLDRNGHKARMVLRDGFLVDRALTFIDERPEEAPMFELSLGAAEDMRDDLVREYPHHRAKLLELLSFMEELSHADNNKLFRPGMELDAKEITDRFDWFRSTEAEMLQKSAAEAVPNAIRLLSFAKSLVEGRACIHISRNTAQFFSYQTKLVKDLSSGTILLDASSHLDGISNIVSWRSPADTPKPSYRNLEITYVPQHTKKILGTYLKAATNRHAYSDWMIDTIINYVKPGERALVVCRKALVENNSIPNWPERDPRFKDKKQFMEDFGWDLHGRKLCVTYYGLGLGCNSWKDADVVLLFDDFRVPRSASVATTQGLRDHRVDEGDFGSMKTMRSKARAVDTIADGHALAWMYQMALRGNARNYDEHGVCGKQRLVISGDLNLFETNVHKLFPDACVEYAKGHDRYSTLKLKLRDLLRHTKGTKVTASTLREHLGRPWRLVSSKLLTAELEAYLVEHGWRYVAVRGNKGSYFERTSTQPPERSAYGPLAVLTALHAAKESLSGHRVT